MKDFCDAVSNVVACSGLVVCCAAKAVVTVFVELFAAFVCLVVSCFEKFQAEFAFEADCEYVVLHLVGGVKTAHTHEGHRSVVV